MTASPSLFTDLPEFTIDEVVGNVAAGIPKILTGLV